MAPKKDPQKPPGNLSAAGKRLWKSVCEEYELEERHMKTLQAVCEQTDRAASARLLVEAEGVCIKDRFNQSKEHPGVAIERNAQLAALRLMRELGLDIEQPETRGPRRPGTR